MSSSRKLLSLLVLLGSIATVVGACGETQHLHFAPRFDADAPAIPTGLVAERDGDTVRLRWDANRQDADLAGYAVYRSPSPGTPFTLVVSALKANRWNDTQALGQTSYYRVAAVDGASNQSPFSDPIRAPGASSRP